MREQHRAIGVKATRFALARRGECGALVRISGQQPRVRVGSVRHRLQIHHIEQHVVATNAVAIGYVYAFDDAGTRRKHTDDAAIGFEIAAHGFLARVLAEHHERNRGGDDRCDQRGGGADRRAGAEPGGAERGSTAKRDGGLPEQRHLWGFDRIRTE